MENISTLRCFVFIIVGWILVLSVTTMTYMQEASVSTKPKEDTKVTRAKPVCPASNHFLKDTNQLCCSMDPPPMAQEQNWLPVDSNNNSLVFSAYFDDVVHKIVVIGTQAKDLPLYCQYWKLSGGRVLLFTSESRPLTKTFLGEDHSRKYKGMLYNCPWQNHVPTHVSVSTNECGPPLHLLRLVNSTKTQQHEHKFTICLKPLHFRYGRAYELVEWIELNKLLGAEKFVIYNYSIATNADQVLRHYSKQGLVEVIQWPLPMLTYSYTNSHTPEIHSIGMLPMLQDCFLRSRQHSEFVINEDVDEYIVPHGDADTTWDDMLKSMPRGFDVYLFRHTVFHKEWNNPIIDHAFKEQSKRFSMTTLQIFEHEEKIWAPNLRSKYMTRTDKIGQLHIHNVLGNGIRTYKAPLSQGYVHHYRRDFGNTDNKRVLDTIILDKYGEHLVNNVERLWKDLHNVSMNIPYM